MTIWKKIREIRKTPGKFVSVRLRRELSRTLKHPPAAGRDGKEYRSDQRKIHADIIIMGSHSRKWLEDIVIGSVAKDVLNHTKIPPYIISTRKSS